MCAHWSDSCACTFIKEVGTDKAFECNGQDEACIGYIEEDEEPTNEL